MVSGIPWGARPRPTAFGPTGREPGSVLEGPSTEYSRTLVPNTGQGMGF